MLMTVAIAVASLILGVKIGASWQQFASHMEGWERGRASLYPLLQSCKMTLERVKYDIHEEEQDEVWPALDSMVSRIDASLAAKVVTDETTSW